MLDAKFIRENTEAVKENLKRRNTVVDVDTFIELDAKRRDLLGRVEAMKSRRNEVTKEISVLKRNKENADMKKLGDEIAELDEKVRDTENKMVAIRLMLPNMCHPSVPVGKDDSDNPEVRKWGELPHFDFQPKDHWEIG